MLPRYEPVSNIDQPYSTSGESMRFGLLIGLNSRGNANSGGWQETLEKARLAESLGIEFLSTGEAWGPSSIPWLTAVALNTSKVTIYSDVVHASRRPAASCQNPGVIDALARGLEGPALRSCEGQRQRSG
jgi:hypothetical protein